MQQIPFINIDQNFSRKYYGILALLCLSFISYAQNGLNTNTGARGMAQANVGLAFQDINSIFSNQAGLAHLDNPAAILFTEQRFALTEIRSIAAGFAYPTRSGTFALQINYFGFEDYNEQKAGIAYARKLTKQVALGAQVNYINFRIPEYGSRGFLSFELGVQIQLAKELTLGAHVANPITQEIVEDEDLPTVFKLGLAYEPSKKVMLSLELEKDIDFELQFKGGIEYRLIKAFALRAGFASNPGTFSFGAGYTVKNLRIDFGAAYHQVLGFTPGLGVVYLLGE